MLLNKAKIILLLLCLLALKLNGSHIIGGEMTMQHINASRYELSIELFYDAEDGQDVVEDSIVISSYRKGDNQKIEDYFMTRSLNYDNAELSNRLCREGLNIRIYTYKATVFIDDNLYNSPGGYYFSWQRCCRSGGISNLLNSGTTGFVFYKEFASPKDFPGNSSPQFKPISGDFYCIGKEVEIDFGAIDKNNDELNYSLITPKAGFSRPDDNVIIGQSGPYPDVNGYYDIPSVNGIQISSNGILTFTPSQTGLFTISVLCEEYRNGEKIGAVIRDIVVLIRDCEENQSPSISFFPYEGNESYIPGDTVLIKSQEDLCHLIETNDPDEIKPGGEVNIIRFDLLGYDIDEPQLNSVQNASKSQWRLCFPSCESPELNFFKMRIYVRDDHCPKPAVNFIDINFKIIESEDIPPIISTSYVSRDHSIGEEIQFGIRVVDPDSSGINISLLGEGFDPESIEMNFEYQQGNCCEANGEFNWTPDCANILDIENYKLSFIARGRNCGIVGKDSLSIDMFVESPGANIPENLSFPNVITPNGDGLNDSFYFPILDENLCLERSFEKIQVYNRWGREVYSSNESSFIWNAEGLNSGQYFYQVKFSGKAFKGFLHILR